jgi:hypothetical protein
MPKGIGSFDELFINVIQKSIKKAAADMIVYPIFCMQCKKVSLHQDYLYKDSPMGSMLNTHEHTCSGYQCLICKNIIYKSDAYRREIKDAIKQLAKEPK